ncbi:RNA polymerase II transcription factor SIII subunit A-domain-containing protein [Cantharellus anzutake]|uniref:RNA polymerase II transcription factor SIII subunit A-domain-containing protein n=1 Tax=Cantharellus anzutake TaxID=1750568 RepID=UPI001908C349|nr:RNA polymerase II transcription factor SIII subunit A-domain-containing protein [Cantharellus anzutake]KAF8334220.1 RNA polymerase II transcription factor SIII subunit A-domain-containing protein [Cantharellus anzutake]
MPYRLAKPILMQCQADQLLEIERSSPADDQEIWEEICVRQFDIQREPGFEAPKSWRKFHIVETARRKKLEEEAGHRIRSKYQELEAQKQEKRLVFTGGSIPPMKRLRVNGWGKSSTPKTLFEKARSETARQAGVYAAGSRPVALGRHVRPLGRLLAPGVNNLTKAPHQTNTVSLKSRPLLPPASNTGVVVTTSGPKSPPMGPSSPTQGSSHSSAANQCDTESSCPSPQLSRPLRVQHSPPIQSPLFMPKHRTLSQLPSRAR